jgi:competence protein ComGB
MEAVSFFEKVPEMPVLIAETFRTEFANGGSFANGLRRLGFPNAVVLQVEFADVHGDLIGTLRSIKKYSETKKRQQEKLIKVASYPIILLLFLIALVVALRVYLLPQLSASTNMADSTGMRALFVAPYVVIGLVVFGLLAFFVSRTLLNRKSHIARCEIFAKIPIVRTFYIEYMTSFLSREWGKLFEQGLEMKDIVELMESLQSYPLLTELSQQMETKLVQGVTFNEQVEQWSFVKKEFGLMIRQGEVKSKLGKELMLFSDICWKSLLFRLEKLMGLIQPAVFLFVGAMILSIYAAIVLPIYDNMGEMTK